MKRNVAMAGAVLGILMSVASVANAETPAVHSGGAATPATTRTAPTEAQKQAKLFQLVNACLAERPGAPSAADDLLKRFRTPGALGGN